MDPPKADTKVSHDHDWVYFFIFFAWLLWLVIVYITLYCCREKNRSSFIHFLRCCCCRGEPQPQGQSENEPRGGHKASRDSETESLVRVSPRLIVPPKSSGFDTSSLRSADSGVIVSDDFNDAQLAQQGSLLNDHTSAGDMSPATQPNCSSQSDVTCHDTTRLPPSSSTDSATVYIHDEMTLDDHQNR